jgi:regulatory protein
MAVITDIKEQRRNPRRRNVYLDGRFAFACNLNVIARFRLRTGMQVDGELLARIEQGEVRQECLDAALGLLSRRLHSRAELVRKLKRRQWGDGVIETVLDDLTRLGYIDDQRFARTRAMSAAQTKRHGRRRAMIDLIKTGVKRDVAEDAISEVYSDHDSTGIARSLAQKQAARLRKLDPAVARRRLAGMLQRRGFDYDAIKPVIDEVLGRDASDD